MKGFKLTENGDISITDGQIDMIDDTALETQTIKTVLSTNRGEYPFDSEEGIYGDKDYEIKAGELFRSKAGVVFYATEGKVIDTPQTEDEDNMLYYTEICVQCTTPGEFGNVSNISDTVNVNTHISSIQYIKQLTTGENTESDAAARERYNTIIDG